MLLAKRYARALFELAAESESLMRIGDDLALLDEMDYSVTLTVPPPVSYTHLRAHET